jgi:hypothetical protein
VKEAASHADPQTAMRYDRARSSLDRHAPTSLAPTSQVPPGRSERRDNLPGDGGRQEGASRSPALRNDHAPLYRREREPPGAAGGWGSGRPAGVLI